MATSAHHWTTTVSHFRACGTVGAEMTTFPRVVWEFIAAVNASDRAWMDALFADDCLVDACGFEARGRESIGSWAETELLDPSITLTVLGVEVRRGVTVVRVDAGDRGSAHECDLEFDTDGRYIDSVRISTGLSNPSRSTEAPLTASRRS